MDFKGTQGYECTAITVSTDGSSGGTKTQINIAFSSGRKLVIAGQNISICNEKV